MDDYEYISTKLKPGQFYHVVQDFKDETQVHSKRYLSCLEKGVDLIFNAYYYSSGEDEVRMGYFPPYGNELSFIRADTGETIVLNCDRDLKPETDSYDRILKRGRDYVDMLLGQYLQPAPSFMEPVFINELSNFWKTDYVVIRSFRIKDLLCEIDDLLSFSHVRIDGQRKIMEFHFIIKGLGQPCILPIDMSDVSTIEEPLPFPEQDLYIYDQALTFKYLRMMLRPIEYFKENQ